jgi:hypothetical protein
MAKLSVREASRRFDVSRPTLVKHLKSGKLSGEPVGGGGWSIDPAEMVRAGYAARPEAVNDSQDVPGKLTTIAPPGSVKVTTQNSGLPGSLNAELLEVKAELEKERILRSAAEALATERAAHIEDLRRMLPAPDAVSSGRKRRWWQW